MLWWDMKFEYGNALLRVHRWYEQRSKFGGTVLYEALGFRRAVGLVVVVDPRIHLRGSAVVRSLS